MSERKIDNFNVALIVLIGLLQGCAIAALSKLPPEGWAATHPWQVRLGWAAAVFLPATAQWLITYRSRPFFWVMLATVATLIGATTWHSVRLLVPNPIGSNGIDSSLPALGFITWIALMSLGEFAATTQRRVSDYPALYSLTIRNVLLPAGAALFTLLVWGLMEIWSGLFKVLGFASFAKLLTNDWLLYPLFGVAFGFGAAVLIGRPNLMENARRVASAISSALLPLAALIVVAFVIGLAIAGPEPLWKTGYASYLILLLSAAFAAFLNAAHDDGTNLQCLPRPLLVMARLAAVLIPILIAVSAYSLGLRIAQYGWTVDRVLGVAALTLAGLTAIGYFTASVRPRVALPNLAQVNIATLGVALLLGIAVITGLLSPTQIAARDQLARILDGRTQFAKIDWHMFAVQLGQPGRDVLEKLAAEQSMAESVRLGAQQALAAPRERIYELNRKIAKEFAERSDYRLLASGEPADAALIEKIDADSSLYPARCTKDCYVLQIDLDGDATDEMVVIREYSSPVYKKTEAGWVRVGRLSSGEKKFTEMLENLRAGQGRAVASAYRNISVDGQLLQFTADTPKQ